MFELRPLSKETVPTALAKAERYRLLNDPRAAESICLDVLDVDPGNQQALIMLLLALTDQFGKGHGAGSQRAREVLAQLEDDYDRAYYNGLICERQAMALMTQRGPRSRYLAYDGFRSAMESYARAAELRPGEAEPNLRWNTCARILNGNPYLVPEPQNLREQMLE
jgi:hypothetical protein